MSLRITSQAEALRWARPRRDGLYASDPGDRFGVFILHRGDRVLKILVSSGVEPGAPPEAWGWEHVSVSIAERGGRHRPALPTWEEMCAVKTLFWEVEDTVVQYHPAESTYVDMHPVLHLWRHVDQRFPTPPLVCV